MPLDLELYSTGMYSLCLVSASFLHHQVVQMVAEGLDTVADVSVNGRVVGRSINMFVGYTFYVKDALKVIFMLFVFVVIIVISCY